MCIRDSPYDTLINVIGCDEGNKTTNASLVDYAIRYEEVGLDVVGCIDIGRIKMCIRDSQTAVHLQRILSGAMPMRWTVFSFSKTRCAIWRMKWAAF